ncbi:MAG: RNA methyltransferase [Thermodesulfovibrionales bacterium]
MTGWRDNIHFVLVEPKEPGNIGSSARAIKNMGFGNLSLVSPPHLSDEARWFAHNALDVLDSMQAFEDVQGAIADKSFVVGTTSRKGKKRGLILPIAQGIEKIKGYAQDGPVAILFGRESRGLYNEEVSECGLLVTVPTNREQPSLNLAQAVMIVAYELGKDDMAHQSGGRRASRVNSHRMNLVTHHEITLLYERMTVVLKLLEYIPRGDRDLEKKIMSNLKYFIGRAGLTDWELNMLHGVLSQVEKKLGRISPDSP